MLAVRLAQAVESHQVGVPHGVLFQALDYVHAGIIPLQVHVVIAAVYVVFRATKRPSQSLYLLSLLNTTRQFRGGIPCPALSVRL